MDVRIEPSWKEALSEEWGKPYFENLVAYVRQEYATTPVFPPADRIFAAFDACPFDRVKVVILGQDPYHEPGQANGLSFSVADGVPLPRSLQNIYRELAEDLGHTPPPSGNLEHWARQGVLLLNSTLTVRSGAAGSHQGHGWEQFTDAAIHALASRRRGLVFILWGAYARRKCDFIDPSAHCIIASPHPSPLSAARGFFGSRPFSRANSYLEACGERPIDWCGTNISSAMTLEQRIELARSLRAQGRTCSQCVVEAFPELAPADTLSAISAAAEGFGSGLGGKKQVCGAVTGATMAMSLAPHASRPALYSGVRKVFDDFEALNGSCICGELKQPGRKPCIDLITDAIRIADGAMSASENPS